MYQVVFAGLACFSKNDGKGRLVLLPDGRDPGERIDPHVPRLVVRNEDVDQIPPGLEVEEGETSTTVTLPRCTLYFEGADTLEREKATLDTRRHDNLVQRLSDIHPDFDGENRDNAVVKLRIRKGRLSAFAFPGSEGEDDPAVVSRLDVPHRGSIDVTVLPAEEFAMPQVIRLRPGAEIVLANSAPHEDPLNDRNHFLIYEKLSRRPVDLSGREPVDPNGLQRLPTNHPFFAEGTQISLRGDCGNTGCCS